MGAHCSCQKSQHQPRAQDVHNSRSVGPIYPLSVLFTCCLMDIQKGVFF